MTLDGTDIKYLLEKHGYSYAKIARELKVTRTSVHETAKGRITSRRIQSHIEKLLGLERGTLKISKERLPPLIKAA